MRDILKELREGAISEETAYDLRDNLWHRAHLGEFPEPPTLEEPIEFELGMDAKEAEGTRRGVPLAVLARWRYEGWPNTCPICGNSIDVETGLADDHWRCVDFGHEWRLVHTSNCYHKFLESRPEPEPLPPFDPTRDGKPGVLRLTRENLLEFVYESGAVQDISHSAFLYLCDADGTWHEVDIQPDDEGSFRCYPDEDGTWYPIEWALNMKAARLEHFVIQKPLQPGPPELL